MKWLSSNATTIAMAAVLSLLTIGLLTKPQPGANEPPLTLPARFIPEVRAEVGSLEFSVDDIPFRDTINVTVSGDRAQIGVISLTCQPILDQSKFPDDPATRETTVRIDEKDFNLTPELASRIFIKPMTIRIKYAPMVTKKLPVEVSLADIDDARENVRFRVDAVRAMPETISVRLPVDKAQTLKALPIRPIRIQGRTKSFDIEGFLNTTLPDMKDVRKQESFWIAVELSPVPFKMEMEGVRLFLSSPRIPGHKAELVDALTYKVVLSGPQDVVERMKPEQIHVFVKLDWGPESQPGTYPLIVRCEVADEALRKLVQVSLAPTEPITAAVQVTRS